MDTYETYSCIVLSTQNLREKDRAALDFICQGREPGMIIKRDTGYLIKLYEESFLNCYTALSPALNNLLITIRNMGFRLVEFNCDGRVLEDFPVFFLKGKKKEKKQAVGQRR